MAIVEMSKLSVICLNSQKKRFIKELMDLGIVEINKPEGNSSENPIPRYPLISECGTEKYRLQSADSIIKSKVKQKNLRPTPPFI